jgi:hypothetical protein
MPFERDEALTHHVELLGRRGLVLSTAQHLLFELPQAAPDSAELVDHERAQFGEPIVRRDPSPAAMKPDRGRTAAADRRDAADTV